MWDVKHDLKWINEVEKMLEVTNNLNYLSRKKILVTFRAGFMCDKNNYVTQRKALCKHLSIQSRTCLLINNDLKEIQYRQSTAKKKNVWHWGYDKRRTPETHNEDDLLKRY